MKKEFIVATDASLHGIGAVLMLKDDIGHDKYIGFISSTLSPSQGRWNTTKRELYAEVVALKKFRKYLWGNHFILLTDHKALVYLHSQKIANPMMIAWIQTILDYNSMVVHLPGALNHLPDERSRLYPPEEDEQRLVEDNGLGNDQVKRGLGKKTSNRRKVFSKDKSLNVLAVQIKENNNLDLDYVPSAAKLSQCFAFFAFAPYLRLITE